MQIYNTLTRQKQEFVPIQKDKVLFYYCGPTVYWVQHIGNLRGMTCADLIHRTLKYLGYEVKFVRNYTDVGHLTSDADEGEDKMSKGARREGKTPDQIANKYIQIFEQDTENLNILEPQFKPRPSKLIPEIISMVQTLMDKGYAYTTDLAVYYDVAKFKGYAKLSKQKLDLTRQGAGKGEVSDSKKKHAQDFALWVFKKGAHAKALQVWPSPWGEGFPGWHIECSVMSKEYLGVTIDLHMGGVEHIPIHHTNEIAQSEAANGTKFVNYWLHNEHLLVDDTKMSKSLGNIHSLTSLIKQGFAPLPLRYFFLQAHYRSRQNFTLKALKSAESALTELQKQVYLLSLKAKGKQTVSEIWKTNFLKVLADDFNIPQALALVWELLASQETAAAKLGTLLDFDQVLGLKLSAVLKTQIPSSITALVKARNKYRQTKDFKRADQVRKEIEEKGYLLEDEQSGTIILPAKYV